jgi:hypothetical protein
MAKLQKKQPSIITGSSPTEQGRAPEGKPDFVRTKEDNKKEKELAKGSYFSRPSCFHFFKCLPGPYPYGIDSGECHEQVTGQQGRNPPDRKLSGSNKGDKHTDNKELVGNSVKQTTLPALHLPPSRHPPIKKITEATAKNKPEPPSFRRKREGTGKEYTAA